MQRRSNLTGATIRVAHPDNPDCNVGKSLELMTKLVVLLQNRFNFSFQNMTWSERGGVINDSLEDRLDVGMKMKKMLFSYCTVVLI